VYQTGKGEKKRSRTTANTPSMNNNTASNSKAQEILIISGNTAIPHHRILYNIRPFDANGLPKTHFLFHVSCDILHCKSICLILYSFLENTQRDSKRLDE
jgi:hypothetical protein